MVMYSAHDDTLMALLYAMNVVDEPFLVPYAATIIFDLYRTKEGHFVEVSYKNNTPNVDCSSKKRNFPNVPIRIHPKVRPKN